MRRAKIIGFISIKGGVGKTTTVANLGFILAKEYGKKVLVVDGNFSGANLALHFGFTKPEYTIHDVLNQKVNLKKAIYEHSSGLHILPASLFSKSVDSSRFHQYLASLRSFYDVILVDSSPALNHEMLATIMASDELFVLTTPDYVTLASTMHAIKVARQRRTYLSGIILNKIRGKRFELDLDDIQDATKVPVVGVLYDNENVMRALAKGKPISHFYGKNDVAVEYKKLAAALIGERYVDKRLKTRVRNLFTNKLSQDEINRAIVMVSHY
ncbi:MAG TPA: AAA family ATPase [Candidatus Nanoarchaeia archaeon]|nr:AAA family ATPase [Candidatus Nanoarchaeia archaeon]